MKNLSQYDRSGDVSWQARQQRRLAGKDPAPYLEVLGAQGGCWCGEPNNHDWPGKDAGEPHPR